MAMTLEQAQRLQIEGKVEDAARILTHYFMGTANENDDMRAEMRTVVESIISAVILTLELDYRLNRPPAR